MSILVRQLDSDVFLLTDRGLVADSLATAGVDLSRPAAKNSGSRVAGHEGGSCLVVVVAEAARLKPWQRDSLTEVSDVVPESDQDRFFAELAA